MSRTLKAVKTGTLVAALVALAPHLIAQQALPRSANPPAGANARREGTAVVIPRQPYAGTWEGSLSLTDGGSAQSLAVRFAVDGSGYTGETRLAGGAPSTNVSLQVARPASSRQSAQASTEIRPRSATPPADAGQAVTGGGPSPSVEILSPTGETFLVPWWNGQPLMCDVGSRCVDMPLVRWEAKGSGAANWIYSAKLMEKDRVEGTVVVRESAGDRQIGTFSLKRKS